MSTDVDRAPTVRIDPRYLEVNEGDPIEFRCIVEGTPAPTVRWTRGPDGPLPDYASVQDGVLRIARVSKADESEYYCTATNAAGTSSLRTIIYVTGENGSFTGVMILMINIVIIVILILN